MASSCSTKAARALGDLARSAGLDRFELGAQQVFTDEAVFVLELLAPDLRQNARAQDLGNRLDLPI